MIVKQPGSNCWKLTTAVFNDSLKFKMLMFDILIVFVGKI